MGTSHRREGTLQFVESLFGPFADEFGREMKIVHRGST